MGFFLRTLFLEPRSPKSSLQPRTSTRWQWRDVSETVAASLADRALTSFQIYHLIPLLRFQRRGEKLMAHARLFRCDAPERHGFRAFGQFHAERGPHLQDRVGETEFEDVAGD